MNAKRITLIAGGAAVLAAAGLMLLALTMDLKPFRSDISRVIKATTGLDVVFEGPIRVTVFPRLGVRLESVSVMAPEAAGGGVLARLGRADVNVRLAALLSKSIEAGGIVLDGIEVNLVRDASGRLNLPSFPVKDVSVKGGDVIVTTENDEIFAINYQIEAVTVSGGRITLDDRLAKRRVTVSNLGLHTGRVERGKPFPVRLGFDVAATDPDQTGTFSLAGDCSVELERLRFAFEKVQLSLAVSGQGLPMRQASVRYSGSLRADLEKQAFSGQDLAVSFGAKGGLFPEAGTDLKLALNAAANLTAGTADLTNFSLDAAGLTLTGEIHATNLNQTPAVSAVLASNEFNPRQTLANLGVDLAGLADRTAFTKARIALDVKTQGNTTVLKLDKTRLDAATIGLDLTVERRARPSAAFTLTVDDLDLDRYLPPASGKPQPGQEKKVEVEGKLPDIPLDATGSVSVGRLKAAGLHVRDITAKLSLKNGQAEVNPFKMSLYQGAANGSAKADLKSAPLPFSLNLTLGGVQVDPLLKDLTGASKLTGTLGANLNLASRGTLPKTILANLGGKADFALRNGAVLGFSLTPEVFQSKEKLLAQGAGQARTTFESVIGTYVIASGVARGETRVVAPPYKVAGQGWVNLASQTLDYKLQAEFPGLPTVPVHLTGSLESPNVSLDAAGVAKGVVDTIVKTPQAVIKAPQDVGKSALDAIGGVLGGKKK